MDGDVSFHSKTRVFNQNGRVGQTNHFWMGSEVRNIDEIRFIGDTHGGYENTIRALEWLNGSDQICHLGDVLYHGPRNDIPHTYNPKEMADYLREIGYCLCSGNVTQTLTRRYWARSFE